jgi:transcriptional regulator of acetoin/glycerol metabolism
VTLGIDAAERILLHSWPDNLRGLNRLVHRLASSADDKPIGLRALQAAAPDLFVSEGLSTAPPPAPTGDRGSSIPPAQGVGIVRPSREEFLAVYNAAGQNVTATSKYYGKDRRQIYRWLSSFGIPREPEDD